MNKKKDLIPKTVLLPASVWQGIQELADRQFTDKSTIVRQLLLEIVEIKLGNESERKIANAN